jgi:hypothetical protein
MLDEVRVFVSHHHSSEEDEFTARLVADLQASNANVWVDDASSNSDDFVLKISEGMTGRQWLVLVMTPAALQSRWVQREVNAAIAEQSAGRMLGVLPIEMTRCEVSDIPLLWRTLQRYNATKSYEAGRDSLFKAMGLTPPPPSSAVRPPEVYMGASSTSRPISPEVDVQDQRTARLISRPAYRQTPSPSQPIAAWEAAKTAPEAGPYAQVPSGPVAATSAAPIVNDGRAAARHAAPLLSRRAVLSGAGALVVIGAGVGILVKSGVFQRGNSSGPAQMDRWRYVTGNKIYSSPTVYNGVVYIGSNDSFVYALDATTGARKWSFQTGNGVNSSPTVPSPAPSNGAFRRGVE